MESLEPTDASTVSRRRLWLYSALVALWVAAMLLATSGPLPMVWDEGNAVLRAEGIERWLGRWAGGRPGPFAAEAIAADWSYTTQCEGHPAFYGIVIAAGRLVSAGWMAPLTGARLGPMLLFGLAAGAMFYRMARQWSPAAACGAVAAMVFLPRLFAHAHFASFDGPLTSCWILAWAAFDPARRKPAWAVGWGALLGMTMSCKATGWAVAVPFAVWAGLYRDRPAAKALLVGVPAALATFFLLNPPLWHAPLEGLVRFWQLNLDRAANPGLNISTQFLGQMYNLDVSLPWWNTLFWTVVAVPLGTLLLACEGLGVCLWRWRSRPEGILLVGQWAVLIVARALPGTPPHDGIRLFLPSFAMLAALAGVGCQAVLQTTGRRRAAVAGLVLLFAGSASSLAWYAPQWLSHYNLLLGGLRGATALGMEPTYYWDGLDRSVIDWLHRNTPEQATIAFGAISPENLELTRRWGILRREAILARASRPNPSFDSCPWYVLQHRPSGLDEADLRLMAHGRPALRKTIRQGGWGPWRLDVPIGEVYPYDEYLAACRLPGTP